jgi:hypothetical protein
MIKCQHFKNPAPLGNYPLPSFELKEQHIFCQDDQNTAVRRCALFNTVGSNYLWDKPAAFKFKVQKKKQAVQKNLSQSRAEGSPS